MKIAIQDTEKWPRRKAEAALWGRLPCASPEDFAPMLDVLYDDKEALSFGELLEAVFVHMPVQVQLSDE